ncbi:hypothetical protein QP324_08935 [Corynebacterium sp. UMB0012]|uniref:hypothetical protein n=1 Tax=Corynebacterium sp. UMB0012 TaxID=3046344 RepID=UPI00254FCFFC|nr:hypothetical protein [Corynebacterium sp. UMB0012]MDK7048698.1 hypothetical protein [Corynebacterium sp. UMB0012]
MHPIIDKAVGEGWPVTELIDVVEAFGMSLDVTENKPAAAEIAIPPREAHVPVSLFEYAEPEVADRKRKHWSERDWTALEQYVQSELSAREIAERMGRTPKAIEHKLAQLKEQ